MKAALSLLLSALIVALAAGVTVLLDPGLVLNERALRWAIGLAGRAGVEVSYRKVDVEASSLALLEKRVRVRMEAPCVRSRGWSACFSRVELSVAGALRGGIPRVTRIGPLVADSGRVVIDLGSLEGGEAEAGKRGRSTGVRIPGWLEGAQLERVAVSIDSWRVSPRGGPPLLGCARVRTARSGLELEVSARRAGDQARISAFASLPPRLEAKIDASVRIPGALPARRLTTRGCRLRVERVGVGHTRASVDCPVIAALGGLGVVGAELGAPGAVSVRLEGSLETPSYPPAPDVLASGAVTARLESIRGLFVDADGEARARFSGVPEKGADGLRAKLELDLGARIPRFDALVERLRHGPWAVPAPFQVLRGTVDARAKGELVVSPGPKGLTARIPLVLSTRLQSDAQRLDLDSTGELELGGGSRLALDTVLGDVRLELPRFELAVPPQLVPDTRFHSGRSSEVAGIAGGLANGLPNGLPNRLQWSARFRTLTDRPAFLISNLAKAPVPVSLDATLATAAPVTGFVRIGHVPVQAFRHEAEIERFQLSFAEPFGDSRIDGKLAVPLADYRVSVLLHGTADKPNVVVLSDPPIPSDQLVSTLLFGEPPDDLDPGQRASVGNTQAALAQGAIGLTSFWVLASTPIQSVTYDPATGRVIATVKLGSGTSLNFGGGGEGSGSQVRLRQRLGPHWTLSTEFETASPTSSTQTASAYLEWSLRY
jgi:hypothetical protein